MRLAHSDSCFLLHCSLHQLTAKAAPAAMSASSVDPTALQQLQRRQVAILQQAQTPPCSLSCLADVPTRVTTALRQWSQLT